MHAKRHVSGVEYLEVSDDPTQRPILVGERTNVIGSRKFKRLVAEGKWEEASEVGRAQVKNGAQIVDVRLAVPDRDETPRPLAPLPQPPPQAPAPRQPAPTDPAPSASAGNRWPPVPPAASRMRVFRSLVGIFALCRHSGARA